MKKVSKSKVASVYAQAMYDAATNKEKIFTEVRSLLSATKDSSLLKDFLSNPIIDFSKKQKTLQSINLSTTLTKSLEVITKNSRSADLDDILQEFLRIYYKKNNILEVEVVSTYQLSKQELVKIEKKIKQNTNQNAVINNVINKDILGGLIIKYNSQMQDVSILGKINQVKRLMKGEK